MFFADLFGGLDFDGGGALSAISVGPGGWSDSGGSLGWQMGAHVMDDMFGRYFDGIMNGGGSLVDKLDALGEASGGDVFVFEKDGQTHVGAEVPGSGSIWDFSADQNGWMSTVDNFKYYPPAEVMPIYEATPYGCMGIWFNDPEGSEGLCVPLINEFETVIA